MAENVTIDTRISLKYDLFSNWSTNNPVLLKGEAALAYIPTDSTLAVGDASVEGSTPPKVMMKIGDGTNHYNDLHFVYGMAADVHGWAKAAVKPEYQASEIKGLDTFIADEIQDTDTQYNLVKVNDYQYKLMSKAKDAEEFTVEVATLDIPEYDDSALTEKVNANEAAIAVLNGTATEAGSVAKAIADAVAALTIANIAGLQDALDAKESTVNAEAKLAAAKTYAEEKATAAQTAATEAAAADATSKANKALDDAKSYADGKDAAIEAAQKAGDDAQDAVDTLAGKVGAVADGTTVVEMISAAQTAATEAAAADATTKANKALDDAKAYADGKVASVTAGDNSVTVGGTATAPTVAAKLSQDADNALTLAADGLKVVIPSAAEYSVVKDESAGDYAAVYHLTKDGVNVGAAINIPKDMVVESGAVVVNPDGQTEGTYIELKLQNVTDPLYINVGSLIEYVTSGSQTGDMVVVNISDDHKVTATITDGSITLGKLATDVQTAIGKAHSHENEAVLNGITADKVDAWDKAEGNAKTYAEQQASAAQTAATEAAAADATSKANKALDDAKAYADGKDAAIEAAQKAGDDAQDAVDALAERVGDIEAKPAMGLTAENITDYNEAVALADTAVQTVTAEAEGGLKVTRTGNDVVIGIDKSVTFIFDCGDSSGI